MKVTPVTLRGKHVTLKPLTQSHCADLQTAAGDLHQLWYTWVPHADDMAAEIDKRNAQLADGTMVPFAVLTPDGTAVGMTTYMNIDQTAPRVEIGSTWYGRSVQRTPLNTEAKRLLLAHAFESLDCIAVEFRTHALKPSKPQGYRTPRCQSRRNNAQPHQNARWTFARHSGLFDPQHRMAGDPHASGLSTEQAKGLTRC